MSESWEWFAADGTGTPLDIAHGVRVQRNIKGRFSPPVRLVESTVPLTPGSRITSVQHDVRPITFGLIFDAPTETETYTWVRYWSQQMDPTRGPGTLRITTPLGDGRQFVGYVVDGLLVDESGAPLAGGKVIAVVTLRCPWPYAQDISDVVESWVTGGSTRHFFPIFPLRLFSSQIFASATITVDSDEDVYPVWSVTGPGSNLVIADVTTGRSLRWAGTLADGETLTIDTRPPELSATPGAVTLGDGTNVWGQLTGYDLFPLPPGTQQVDISFNDAVDGVSAVSCRYRANRRTA